MKISDWGEGQYAFICPACNEKHVLGSLWDFNGDYDRPTFTPSILRRVGHYSEHYDGEHCWCTFNKEHPDETPLFTCVLCHSYITDGKIQYLPDCSHELAGQTVDLPEWENIKK